MNINIYKVSSYKSKCTWYVLMKRVDNIEMKLCFPESMFMKYTYLFYFLETVFQPIELTRKVTSVPRNILGAPVYPTPTQVTPGDIGQPSTSDTAKVINPIPSTSSNYTYDECNPIPFFRTDFQPTELGYVSEEEGSRSETSPTSSTDMLVS